MPLDTIGLDAEGRSVTPGSAPFDGIICLGGEDWWYHNRGHFDFQILRRLARRWPVLYVNSIGVRFPSARESRVFAQRIARKLASLKRGLVTVENKFTVFSPFMVPGPTGQKVSGWALGPQIRLAAARLGMRRPLLWVHCPAGAAVLDAIAPVATVLQRTDRFEAFPEGDGAAIARMIALLKRRAELVIYCNEDLRSEEQGEVKASILVTHGVEYDRFAAAGRGNVPEPADLAGLPRPRVGFVGGIDAHTFDPDLFNAVAARLPQLSFAMVGGCSLPKGWCLEPHVYLLGRKPYDEVASYMAACDVLIMPWNRSDWIAACNPIKLKEYLATGRPVVTRDFPALKPYRGLVRTAETADDFAAAIAEAIATPGDAEARRAAVASESWDAKASEIAAALLAIKPAPGNRVPAAVQ